MNGIAPLRRIRSIKMKLSIVIVAAVAVTAAISIIGYQLGWPVWVRPVIAGSLALAMVQLLAKGMTRPLREMDLAARAMAEGDYERRIETAGADEVGRLAESFNAMGHQLAAADRLRRDLLANVSHELRTPLAGVKATLENLADGVAAPTPEVLATMAAQVDRLSRLVSDVLDLSRFEAGELVMRPEVLDVASLVDAAVSELRFNEANGEALAVLVAVEPEDLALTADADRLHQVLLNLLTNAVRHGAGPIGIRVFAAGTERLEFVVTDEGPGIAPGEVAGIFDRFRTGTRSTGGGSGLGLAIARWIVELHAGRINLGPNPALNGRGCQVTVQLPKGGPLQ